jgi:hypothetical protein
MDRENLTNDQAAVFALLGELRADVKHILSGLHQSKEEMKDLQSNIEQDTQQLNDRLSKVEKFNTKVIAYASVALPVLMIALQLGIPALLALI